MKKKPSIKDIAAQLNISTTTVSFILNGKSKEKGVSAKLTEKVLHYVQEIGYKPNMLAKSLRTGKTKIICLLMENIADPFFSSIAGHIEELFIQHGYKIIYGSTKNEPEKTSELIQLFKDRQVDGFIIAPSQHLETDIKSLLSEHIPLVLFDRYYKSIDTDTVIIDNFNSAYQAVKLLINQQYKNIAIVTLDSDQTQMHDRLLGYFRAINEHGLISYVKKINYAEVARVSEQEISNFLISNPEIDAVFFGTNYLTLSGLIVIEKLNLSIPDKIGVISFDDHDIFKLFKPNITAVAQPIGKMTEEIVNLLLTQIDSPDPEAAKKYITVPAIIHQRQSSSPQTRS